MAKKMAKNLKMLMAIAEEQQPPPPPKRGSISIDGDVWEQLDQLRGETGLTMSRVIQALITFYEEYE